MNRARIFLAAASLCVATMWCPHGAQAAGVRQVAAEASRQAPSSAPAPDWRAAGFPESWVAGLQFQELPVERILEVQARNARNVVKPTQVGIARSTALEGHKQELPPLRWFALANGGSVARIRVQSPDAMAVRVGLRLDAIDPRVELRFAGSSEPDRVVAMVRGVEAERLADPRGVYWTPVTDGDSQVIEVYAPAGVPVRDVRLEVDGVSHLLTDSRNSFQISKIGESGECNVDVACRVSQLGADFVQAKNAVAHMVFVVSGSSYICTGTLLNDAEAGTQVPYFYSANHCISDQAVANTLNTFWGYEATGCGNGVAASTTQLAGGASLLFADATTDALLLRLNNPAPAGATFAGWDAGAIGNSVAITAIHHPAGDAKKVSTGQTVGSDASQISVGWLSGTTEGGSSGSGLFRNDANGYYLVGGLHGGSASCANTGSLANGDNRDYYSRLDVVFPQISQFLSGGNAAPTADFSYSISGLTATFTDLSADADGSIASRQWDFGDGAQSGAANPAHSYAAAGTYNVRLTVTDDEGGTHSKTTAIFVSNNDGTDLPNGQAIANIDAAAGAELRYSINVPAGASDLRITTTGANGDADLYVKFGSAPTQQTYDCRSYSGTSNESCSFATPQAGTYHVMVHAYAAFSDLSLLASYTGGVVLPTLSVSDVAATEGDNNLDDLETATFVFRLSEASTSNVSFRFSIEAIEATRFQDYLWQDGITLTIPAGQTSTSYGVAIVGDYLDEVHERFRLRVTDINGAVAGRTAAIGTILDDDPSAAYDFDSDGISDILWRNMGTGANTIWRAAVSSNQQPVTDIRNLAWEMVGVGDFDGDLTADIFWRNAATGANAIWPGANYADRRNATAAGLGWKVVGVGDFDGDGEDDVLWRHGGSGANTIWRSGYSGSRQHVTAVANLDWDVAGVADFNGDGKDDILWRNHSTGANVIWRSGSSANRQAMTRITNLAWRIVGSGDFDGDGRADVLWRNIATGANAIWRSANYATPQSVTSIRDLQWKIVAVGDYNGDTRADILWRHAGRGRNAIWLSADYGSPQPMAPVSNLAWTIVD